MSKSLHVALISGPSYDPLYDRLGEYAARTGTKIVVGFRGDHPALNRHLAGLDEVPYDLVSTHSKYAPSQLSFLARLDEFISPQELEDFEASTLDLARIDGRLYGLPRCVDVRLLHYRTDLIETPPETWDDLFEMAGLISAKGDIHGFAFPGRDSGLFGTFYELVEMAGGSLFPESGVPEIENEGGKWALKLLKRLYLESCVPKEVPDWHFDEVHLAFREGRVSMIGDWPGFYSLHNDTHLSSVVDRFSVCPYPTGPSGLSRAYGGEHTFALTRTGIGKQTAVDLLKFLTAPEQQLLEASSGSVPARKSVLNSVRAKAQGTDRARWDALEKVIKHQALIPPKMACYPEIEHVIWRKVQQGFTGSIGIDETLRSITKGILEILR